MAAPSVGPASLTPHEPRLGRLLLRLFTYHVLVLAGGLLLIWGFLRGDPTVLVAGGVVLAGGIGYHLVILMSAGRLSRALPPIAAPPGAGPRPALPWVCIFCGGGARRAGPCPRCGRILIRRLGSAGGAPG